MGLAGAGACCWGMALGAGGAGGAGRVALPGVLMTGGLGIARRWRHEKWDRGSGLQICPIRNAIISIVSVVRPSA